MKNSQNIGSGKRPLWSKHVEVLDSFSCDFGFKSEGDEVVRILNCTLHK